MNYISFDAILQSSLTLNFLGRCIGHPFPNLNLPRSIVYATNQVSVTNSVSPARQTRGVVDEAGAATAGPS